MMNTALIDCSLKWLAKQLSILYINKSLPENITEKLDIFYNTISRSFNWYTLELHDAVELGFLCLGDASDTNNVWFIPAWLEPTMPDGLLVYDSEGVPFHYHRNNLSTEIRYGCLSCGLIFKKDNDSVIIELTE